MDNLYRNAITKELLTATELYKSMLHALCDEKSIAGLLRELSSFRELMHTRDMSEFLLRYDTLNGAVENSLGDLQAPSDN